MARPAKSVTCSEAAAILGLTRREVAHLVKSGDLERHHGRLLSRAEVEDLAASTYPWKRAAQQPQAAPYWLTGQRAADALGVNRARLGQLADAGRLPFVRHRDGTRLYRRAQLEVIANARALMAPTGVRVW